MFRSLLNITLIASLMTALLPSAGSAHRSRFYSHNRKMHVVATNPAIAEITEQIGGDKVYVTSLLKADQEVRDPKIYHSMIQATREAKVLIRLGVSIDPWIDALASKSGNRKVAPGADGYVDCSTGISSVSEGYWLDPVIAKTIAANIATGFSKTVPEGKSFFTANYEAFCGKIDENLPRWQAKLANRDLKAVACCGNLEFFNRRFGIDQIARMETAHGNEPSSQMISDLVTALKSAAGARMVMVESLCPLRSASMIAERSGSKLVEIPSSVYSKRKIRDYIGLIDIAVSFINDASGESYQR